MSLPMPVPPVHIQQDSFRTLKDGFEAVVDENDSIWTEYLNVADEFDRRLVEDCTGIVDSILVFVALFISVLTAFIIDSASGFDPDQAVITNELLKRIYIRMTDSSAPFDDPQPLFQVDPKSASAALFESSLLYTSLALSIIVAAVASAGKIWLIRYNRTVSAPAPPYQRAMRRHRAYTGLVEWRLQEIIESLYVIVTFSVVLFGLFIHSSIKSKNSSLGYVIGIILLLGLAFIVVSSVTGAFVAGSPFRWSFSDFLKFLYDLLPPYSRIPQDEGGSQGSSAIRDICVLVVSIAIACVTAYVIRLTNNGAFTGLVFFPIASVFAVQRRPEEREDMKPRRHGLPRLTLLATIVIASLISASAYLSSAGGFYGTFVSAHVILAMAAVYGIYLTHYIPKTAETEAVAWLLKVSRTHDHTWFEKAVDTAGTSEIRKAVLLEKLLPLLTPLIASVPHETLHHPTPALHTYLTCLARLCPASIPRHSELLPQFLSNEVFFDRPLLSPKLSVALRCMRDCNQCIQLGLAKLANDILACCREYHKRKDLPSP